MLNAITPLRAPLCIVPAYGQQNALQSKAASTTIKGLSNQAVHQVKLSDLTASHQERDLDEILAAFRGPSAQVQYPLDNEVIQIIKEQLLLVRQFEQEIEDFSVDRLRELISNIKQILNPSIQATSDLREQAVCQLLAVANHVFAQYFNLVPYHVQILAVLGILASKGDFKGSLAQIKTGEGKSTVVTLLALILACQGKCIDVITSNEYLSKRDERKYKSFFNFFDIPTSHICDRSFTPDHFSGQVIYGTNYNFEFSILFDNLYLSGNRILYNDRSKSRPFHVAIVDEVDNMLLDKAAHSARIAYPSQKNLTALYPIIYVYIKANCDDSETPGEGVISSCKKLVERYELAHTQLKELIDSAYQACFKHKLDEHYCLRKPSEQTKYARQDENLEVVIIDKDTGRLSEKSRWQHGLHQFLEYKHGLPIQEDTLTLGALSHPAFFAYYEEIYGVTGSLGADIERNEVTEVYGLTSFDVPTHKPPLMQQLPTIICRTQQEFNRALLGTVLDMTKAGRPCLVLCRSIEKSYALYQLIKQKVSDVRLLNDVQNEDEDFLVANAAHSGAVTVATDVAARGTDIVALTKAAKNGGLHVMPTFYSESYRGEIQQAGRGGRQGNPGSYGIILPPDDELLLKTDSSTIEELVALREKMVKQASLARRQYGSIYLAQHHILERFFNDFQHKFSNSINRHAILNKWAEFYTDLENVTVNNLEYYLDPKLLSYRQKLNSLYDHFIKSLVV